MDWEPIKAQIFARIVDPNLRETLTGLRTTMKYDVREDRRTAIVRSERSAGMRVTRIT